MENRGAIHRQAQDKALDELNILLADLRGERVMVLEELQKIDRQIQEVKTAINSSGTPFPTELLGQSQPHMEVEYPDKITILGHTYSVKIGIWSDLDDQNLYGETDHRTQEIRLNIKRPPSQMQETLLHEILHIVSTNLLQEDLSEYQIRLLAKGLNEALTNMGILFEHKP